MQHCAALGETLPRHVLTLIHRPVQPNHATVFRVQHLRPVAFTHCRVHNDSRAPPGTASSPPRGNDVHQHEPILWHCATSNAAAWCERFCDADIQPSRRCGRIATCKGGCIIWASFCSALVADDTDVETTHSEVGRMVISGVWFLFVLRASFAYTTSHVPSARDRFVRLRQRVQMLYVLLVADIVEL